MTYRVAVLGAGLIGATPVRSALGVQSHAAAWKAHRDAELVALCDAEPARLAAAQAAWGVAAGFSDPVELLRTIAPDIVSICTPDATHGALLEAALETDSVTAILAEKPLTLDLSEGHRLVETAARRGVTLAVNYGRRSTPSHRRLRDWLATRPIGELEIVRGVYVRGIKHNGTHWLDLARFLVGEITEIHGIGRTTSWQTDGTIDAALTFAGGARGELIGLKDASYALFEMDLIGTEGRIQLLDSGRRFEARGAVPSDAFPGFFELQERPGPSGGLDDMLLHVVSDLVDALESKRPPACTGEDALIALRLADRALATTRSSIDESRFHEMLRR
jgi:predicted dehydrogenase